MSNAVLCCAVHASVCLKMCVLQWRESPGINTRRGNATSSQETRGQRTIFALWSAQSIPAPEQMKLGGGSSRLLLTCFKSKRMHCVRLPRDHPRLAIRLPLPPAFLLAKWCRH